MLTRYNLADVGVNGPDDACLFFRDRVRSDDFRIIAVRDGQRDPSFLAGVREAGRRADITIVI